MYSAGQELREGMGRWLGIAPAYLGLQMGRLEWQGLKSSGSFLVHIWLVPVQGWARLWLSTSTCGLSTVWWIHSNQTFYVMAHNGMKIAWPFMTYHWNSCLPSHLSSFTLYWLRQSQSCPGSRSGDINLISWWDNCQRICGHILRLPYLKFMYPLFLLLIFFTLYKKFLVTRNKR